MESWIVTPPIALLLYLGLVGLLYVFGRLLAPKAKPGGARSGLYASGELAEDGKAAPGYRRFFVVALFFAVLHLGALVLGTFALGSYGAGISSELSLTIALYLFGLAVTLLVVALG